jgi:hypothetical protein
VLPDSMTDHRPVVTTVRAGSHVPGAEKLVSLKRRNFKAVTRPELEGALCKKALLRRAEAPEVLEEVLDVLEEVPDVTGEVPDDRQEVGNNPQEVGNSLQEVSDGQLEVDDDVTSGRHIPKNFFKFGKAKRISKTIKGLNNKEALGMDGIPTSVLKKGVEVLAGPILHLVNRSMAEDVYRQPSRLGKSILFTRGRGSHKRTQRPIAPSPSCLP